MANDRTIQITLKAVSDMSDVLSNVKQLQNVINQLKLPDKLKQNFTKLFTEVEQNGAKVATTLASGFKNKGDVTKYTQGLNGVEQALRQIQISMSKIDPSILQESFQIDPKKIEQAQEEVLKYRNALQELGSSATGLNNIESNITALTKKFKVVRSSATEFVQALKSGDIDTAKVKYQEFIKGLDKIKDPERRAAYEQLAQSMQTALSSIDTGKLDKLKSGLQDAQVALKELNSSEFDKFVDEFEKLSGVNLRNLISQFTEFNHQQQESAQNTQVLNSELDQIKHRVAYFFNLANAVNLFRRAVRSAFETIKDLDKVMTETAVVTNFSVGDMWAQLPEYTKRANKLGVSIHDAYEAATLYYQQGLSTNEVMAVSNETLKMARIAGLNAADATDRMTNALRGFNMAITETNAQNINDVYSNLAAKTASNVDEISTAMTKVASLAHNANMSFENTAAFLSQIIETTRESAETAGTALKTVIARFSEVKSLYSKDELLGEVDGEEINVNKISKALRTAGINLNEYLTGMKGLDQIFIELSKKWSSLDTVQQRYIATMAAGSRQQSRFIALMQDNARMTELVREANNASGASQAQFDKTLDSLQSKLEKLQNAWKSYLMGLADSDIIKTVIDLLTGMLSIINSITGALPGLWKSTTSIAITVGGFALGKTIAKHFLPTFLSSFRTIGAQSGDAMANTMVARIGKANIKQRLLGAFRNFRNGFAKDFRNFSLDKVIDFKSMAKNSATEFNKSLTAQLQSWKLDSTTATEIQNQLEAGNYAQAQAAAKATGHQFTVTGEQAKEMNLKVVGATQGLQSFSTACSVAGMGLMILVSVLEKSGTVSKPVLSGLKTFTVILMGFPVIMKAVEAAAAALGATITAATGGIVLAIGAAIALIVGIGTALKQNTHKEKLKRLTEAANEAAEAASKASDEYKNLKDTLNSLKDQYKTIDGLTKGTQAWRDAVQEANLQVLDLLEKYPDLPFYNEGGILKIDYGNAYDKFIQGRYDNILVASGIAAQRRIDVITQQSYGDFSDIKNIAGYLGIDSQDLFEDIALKLLSGELTQDTALGYIQKTTGNRDFITFRDGSTRIDDDTFNAILKYAQGVLSNSNKIAGLNSTIGASITQMAGLVGESAIIGTNFLTPEQVRFYIDRAEADIAENGYNKDDYEAYWSRQGKNVTIDAKGAVTVDGTSYDSKTAKAQYAMYLGLRDGAKAVREFTNNLSNANPELQRVYAEEEGGALTKKDILGFFGNTIKDVADVSSVDWKENDVFTENAKNAYKQITGKDAGKEENKEEFELFAGQLFNKILVAAQAHVDATKTIANKAVNSALEVFDGFTASQRNSITEGIASILATSGEEVAANAASYLSSLMQDLTEEDKKKFASLLGTMDWSSISDVQEFGDRIKELGIPIDTTSDAFKILTESMLTAAKATERVNIDKAIKQVNDLSVIRTKFEKGEATRVWTKEEYEKLVEAGVAKATDFYLNDQGEYIYLGDSLDNLRVAVEDATEALTNKQNVSLENQIKARDALKGGKYLDYNWEDQNDLTKEFMIIWALRTLKGTGIDLSTLGLGLTNDSTYTSLLQSGSLDKVWSAIVALSQDTTLEDKQQRLNDNTSITNLRHSSPMDVAQSISNNPYALSTLITMATEAGVNEADISSYSETIKNATEEQKTFNAEKLAFITLAYQEAAALGLDMESFNKYKTSLQETYNLSADVATRVALANTKLNAGLGEIISSYKDWTALIKNGKIEVSSSDDVETFNKLKASVQKMLGLTEPLSEEFWNTKENILLIKQAAEGSTEAIAKLQKAAAVIYLNTELRINHADATLAIDSIIDLINNANLPPLEAGVQLTGKEEFIAGLNDMIEAAGLTVPEIQKLFDKLGYTVEFETAEQRTTSIVYDAVPTTGGHGALQDFTYEPREIETVISVPVAKIKHLTSNGSGGGGISHTNTQNASSNKPSSSSSGSSKPSYWKNPYDELFNLQEKINEALRTRESLERKYQKLLKSETTTLEQIRAGYRDQIMNLQQQLALQRQFQQERLRQINELGNQYYVDSEGRRRTYASLGVTQYANYNAETGEITIDWDALEAIARNASRSEEGAAVEAYISALQELVSSYEQTRDAIWDIEDAIDDLNKELVDSYISFEDRVMEAVVAQYEREIESLEKINDTINDATSKMIDNLQRQIDAQRQERENTKTEEEIARMEARLAYLRQDTSGANSLEIMQLEKDLEDARQNYEDSLIDQALQQMQQEADLAAEQRAQQIEVMRAQLEIAKQNGSLWSEVYGLIADAWDEEGNIREDSPLVRLLALADGREALSEVGQQRWWEEYVEGLNSFVGGIQAVLTQYGDRLSTELVRILEVIGGIRQDINAEVPPVSPGSGSGSSGGENTSNPGGPSTSPGNNNPGDNNPGGTTTPTKISEVTQTLRKGDYGPNVRLLRMALHSLGIKDFNGDVIPNGLEFDEQVEQGVINFQANSKWGGAIAADGIVGGGTRKKFKLAGYKTGGLADFTGPAWLDGTKTHPELVLNAHDTENFLALRNILSRLLIPDVTTPGAPGDTYIDIDINAEVGSDYDVQQLADEIKRQIVRDANYRNNTLIR